LAGIAKKAPRVIAQNIIDALHPNPDIIQKVDIAGPGFLNFTFGWGFYRERLAELIEANESYGCSTWGNSQKIQIEFVSANPTGPLNVVSARAATIGDVLVNMMNAVGFDARREYYINDAGRQVNLLGQSVSARYMTELGHNVPFPEDGYHGEYITGIAKEIILADGTKYQDMPESDRSGLFARMALEKMIYLHQSIMEEYGVHFQCWYHEPDLRKTNAQQMILDYLKNHDFTYEEENAIWFRSQQFGDEKDRVLVTSDGNPTYFLIDIAYHKDKFERGFRIVYDLWGPDHHGYIPRMKAAIQALGYDPEKFHVEIIQQVNLLRGGEVFKMSKRAGQIIEMREVINEVGVDVARYFFVNRRMSSHLDFDIDLAKKQSDENPVFYLQYAHARICSIIRKASEGKFDINGTPDFNKLQEPEELELIKELLHFPDVVTNCVKNFEPHLLPVYLQQVATLFHAFYHNHRVVGDDIALSQARMALCQATRIVLVNGFKLLGISAPEKM
jgi:arginyl-tRNA synthetase